MDPMLTASELQIMQEEVSCLNGLGIEHLLNGKLKKASENFHHALARLKVISKMKKHFGLLPNLLDEDSSCARAPYLQKSCEPVPIDTSSSVLSSHWETFASVALMYNAALVHFKCEKLMNAKTLLDLARGLLKKELNEGSMQHVLSDNKYAAAIVISLYIAYGRVILKLPNGDRAQANQAFKMASLLVAQVKATYRNPSAHVASHNPQTQDMKMRATPNYRQPTVQPMQMHDMPMSSKPAMRQHNQSNMNRMSQQNQPDMSRMSPTEFPPSSPARDMFSSEVSQAEDSYHNSSNIMNENSYYATGEDSSTINPIPIGDCWASPSAYACV